MVNKKNDSASTALNREDIERLIDVIHSKGIEEFELEQGGTRLRIVSNRPATVQYVTAAAPAPPAQHAAPAAAPANVVGVTSSSPAAAVDEDARFKKVTSPMVGTFYRSPSPGSKSFVEIGDRVDEDSVLCIIEAMKLMNEIKAEMRGTIRKILVDNGTPIEYGQAIFLVEPD